MYEAFSPLSGSRPEVPHIAVVMWDGKVQADFDNIIRIAIGVRQLGVRLLVVGLGTFVDVNGLAAVASQPASNTTFSVSTAANLTAFVEPLVWATCNGD